MQFIMIKKKEKTNIGYFKSQGSSWWWKGQEVGVHVSRTWRNAAHYSTSIPGYPTSNGCIHLGGNDSVAYKKVNDVYNNLHQTMRFIYY